MATVRNAPVYQNGKKIAEIESADFEEMDGGEPQIGSEGYIDDSDGPITSTLSCNTILPVAGMTVRIRVGQRYVMGIFIDGELKQCRMKCRKAKYTTDSKNGTAKGQFEFGGGPATASI
jgi:hypothetical protein